MNCSALLSVKIWQNISKNMDIHVLIAIIYIVYGIEWLIIVMGNIASCHCPIYSRKIPRLSVQTPEQKYFGILLIRDYFKMYIT